MIRLEAGSGLNNKGSVTVEAMIVFTVIILCVFALIFMGLIFYHQIMLQSVVDEFTQNAAYVWAYMPERGYEYLEKGITGQEELMSKGLYWNIWDNGQKERLNVAIEAEIVSKSTVFTITKTEIDADLNNYIIYKRLTVDANVIYRLPTGNLLAAFGLTEDYTINVHSEAAVQDTSEFIRNTDWVMTFIENSGLEEFIKDKFSLVKEKIEDIQKMTKKE